MRIALLGLALFGCVGAETPAAGGAALVDGARWTETPPVWVQRASVLQRRGALELLAGPATIGAPQTDERPARPLVVRDRLTGRHLLPPAPAWVGELAGDGVYWVATDGRLLHDDGAAPPRTVDREVIPEIDLDPSGTLLAYAKGPGDAAGVYVVAAAPDGNAPRRVTPGLAVADRPLFADADTLVIAGARPGGIAGLWLLRPRGVEVRLRPLTNAQLRAGRPLGPGFVPPPAFHASMRIEDGAVLYDDGERERRVALGEVGR